MPTFLIVDPNPVTRSMLRTLLSDAGHPVEAVGSLIAARGAIAALRPDGIVVEAGHPRAAEFIRGLETLSSVPRRALCVVAGAEDIEVLTQHLTTSDYRVFDRSMDDAAFVGELAAYVGGLMGPSQASPTIEPDPIPAEDEMIEDGEKVESNPIMDVYKELGVAASVNKQLLVYCDLHRIGQAITVLTPAEQTQACDVLLDKMQQPIASYDGRICVKSRNGVAALFDAGDVGTQGCGAGFHAAIELVYVAQQFQAWLRQRFPEKGVREFGVSLALDRVDVDDELSADQALDPELKLAITHLAQFATLSAKRGWSLVATDAALRAASMLCRTGEHFNVRLSHARPTELYEVVDVAMEATSSLHERITQMLRANGALLKHTPSSAAPVPSRDAKPKSAAPMLDVAPLRDGPMTLANMAPESPGGHQSKASQATVPDGIPDPETGLCVPGYRFLRPLGKGGMAEVFLAVHLQSGEERVLKMLPINDGEEEQLQRFIQEYALISQIRDPNVATIYEQGFTETHAYIAMEYLPGGELRAVMKRGLTVEQTLDWTQAIAGALVAVHAKGITHRDLKPANLMLRANGTLALADFGIAKGQSELLNRTANGHIVGSPYYLSPEQAESKPIDARCDLYSLGIIMFEMLTGTKPYRAGNLSDLIRQHVVAPIPKLPEEFVQFQPLIDCLLAKKPSDRIESAELLLRELRSIRAGYERTDAGTYPPPAALPPPQKVEVVLADVYTVAVIGFDETEKIVISSTLSLSRRRKPRFVEFDVNQGGRPDLFLVDARDMLYLQTMLSTNLDRAVPTVLVGISDFGTRWPVLKRPIQWAKIFEAFDRILLQYETAKSSVPA